eukprot:g27698.t1
MEFYLDKCEPMQVGGTNKAREYMMRGRALGGSKDQKDLAFGAPVPMVTAADLRSAFFRVNPQKANGLDGVPGHALRSCMDQLAAVTFPYYELKIPPCFRKTTIVPMLKKNHAARLNDYLPSGSDLH